MFPKPVKIVFEGTPCGRGVLIVLNIYLIVQLILTYKNNLILINLKYKFINNLLNNKWEEVVYN